MQPSVSLFGPIDTYVAPYITYVLLGLLLVNMVARAREYHHLKDQAEEGDWDDLSRSTLRVATNVLLIVGAFYYMTVEHHGGMVFSIIVLGLFLTDLFEFESRQVEVRRELDLERPKAAIGASMLALLYILYQTLFFVIEPVWNPIV
jgi:hypothetical protein